MARPEETKNPTTSVIVAIKTLEAIAGSILLRFKKIEIVVPAKPAIVILMIIAIANTASKAWLSNQAKASPQDIYMIRD